MPFPVLAFVPFVPFKPGTGIERVFALRHAPSICLTYTYRKPEGGADRSPMQAGRSGIPPAASRACQNRAAPAPATGPLLAHGPAGPLPPPADPVA